MINVRKGQNFQSDASHRINDSIHSTSKTKFSFLYMTVSERGTKEKERGNNVPGITHLELNSVSLHLGEA